MMLLTNKSSKRIPRQMQIAMKIKVNMKWMAKNYKLRRAKLLARLLESLSNSLRRKNLRK